MKKKFPINTAWPFALDHVHSWAYWAEAFSKEECKKIIQLGESQGLEKARVLLGDPKMRNSEITWIFPYYESKWIFERMAFVINELNNKFFKFDLFGSLEGFQFTKYTAPGGKYGRHTDNLFEAKIRKLSFTLQLSDPEDYEGGDLLLHTEDPPISMKREQGYVAVFPSYSLHEVTPVTKGTRYSLVSWITGPSFK